MYLKLSPYKTNLSLKSRIWVLFLTENSPKILENNVFIFNNFDNVALLITFKFKFKFKRQQKHFYQNLTIKR